jgi:hypothetical protein
MFVMIEENTEFVHARGNIWPYLTLTFEAFFFNARLWETLVFDLWCEKVLPDFIRKLYVGLL